MPVLSFNNLISLYFLSLLAYLDLFLLSYLVISLTTFLCLLSHHFFLDGFFYSTFSALLICCFILVLLIYSCINFYYTARCSSYTHTYILFHILFLCDFSQGIKYSSQCYIAVPFVYPFSIY